MHIKQQKEEKFGMGIMNENGLQKHHLQFCNVHFWQDEHQFSRVVGRRFRGNDSCNKGKEKRYSCIQSLP